LNASTNRPGCALRLNTNELAKPPGIGATLIVGSLSINLLSLALPLVLLQIFDRIIPNAATQTLSVLFFGLLIALGFELVLKTCRIVLLAHDSARYEVDLTVSACAKILDTDVFAFSRESAGTHSDRLAAIAQMRDHYCGQGRLLAIDMPFTVLFIGLIWYIAEWLVLVPFVCLGIILVISMVIRSLQAPLIAKRQSIDRRRNSFMMEVLARISTVKALSDTRHDLGGVPVTKHGRDTRAGGCCYDVRLGSLPQHYGPNWHGRACRLHVVEWAHNPADAEIVGNMGTAGKPRSGGEKAR